MAAKLPNRKLVAAVIGTVWFTATLLASPQGAAAGGWGYHGGYWGGGYPRFGFSFGPYPYAYYPPAYYPPSYPYYSYYPYPNYAPPVAWQQPTAAPPSPPPREEESFIVLFHFDEASLNREARGVLDQVVQEATRSGGGPDPGIGIHRRSGNKPVQSGSIRAPG